MAKKNFRAQVDGTGRVRYFVDGSEHTLDEYVQKYIKEEGRMPEIPVGLGGRAPDEPLPVTSEEILQAELAKARAEAEFLRGQIEQLAEAETPKPVETEDELATVRAELGDARAEVEALKRQVRELNAAKLEGTHAA